jgi:hypothetical protein
VRARYFASSLEDMEVPSDRRLRRVHGERQIRNPTRAVAIQVLADSAMAIKLHVKMIRVRKQGVNRKAITEPTTAP